MRRPPRTLSFLPTPLPTPKAKGPRENGAENSGPAEGGQEGSANETSSGSPKSVEPKEVKLSRQTRPPSAPSQGRQNLHLTIFWKALWKSLLK